MAISDAQKIDDLYKKLVFGVTKTDVSTNKSPSNEAIASPLLVRGDQLWNQSGNIPSTPPGSTSGVVEVRTGTSKVAATSDPTVVPSTRTWITGFANWIPPQFGSSYTVKVYADSVGASNPQVTGTLLPPDGINSDAFIFDYQAGVLNFADTNLPAALTGKTIYIVGYTYTGSMGVNNNASIGDLTVTGATLGTSVTNGNVTIDANGTGSVVLNDKTSVNGALSVTGAVTSTTTVSAPSLSGNVTSTGLSTFANVDINSGTIDATTIGATTRADAFFNSVTGGTATFASINNTPIGNAVPSTGAFTTLDANGNVNFTGQAQSTLTNNGAVVIAGGVGITKNLNVGGDAIITGNLTVQGVSTTVNSQNVSTVDNNITVASGALNAAQADGAGLTVAGGNATFTYDGGNNTWNVNKTFNIPTVKVSDATQASNPTSGSLQTVGGAGVSLDLWVGGTIHGNIATSNLQATGGSATGLTNLQATNFSSGNATITGGSLGGSASIDVTNGTIDNFTSGNVLITGGSITGATVDVTTITASNVNITGGNVTGLTNLGSTNGTVTNFVSSNIAVTGGTMSGVTITTSPISGSTGNFTTMTTADAQITGGNVTSINTLGATNGTVTNLSSGNVTITGGSIAGSASIDVTNGTIDNMTSGNIAVTGGNATGLTNLQSTNFASGNVTITGGTVTALSTLGATTATFTTTNAGNLQATSGTVTGLTTLSVTNGTVTNFTTGNAQVTGGLIAGSTTIDVTDGTVDNLTTGNLQATGGSAIGLTNLGATFGTVTNLTSGNVALTGGFVTGLQTLGATNGTVTNFTTGNAQITGGSATGLQTLGATTATFTTTNAGNLQATSGTVTGLTTLGATTATFTTTNAGNLQATSGTVTGLTNFTTTNGTVNNFISGNVDINGGTIDGTSVGAAVASTGAFTTLSATSGITGNLVTAVQTAITQVGTLSELTVAGNVGITGFTTFNGNITIPTGYYITMADQPASGADTQLANKGYVDSKISGLAWQKQIQGANLIGEASSIPVSPTYRDSYIVLDAADGGVWTGKAGHLMQWDGVSAWNDLSLVQVDDRYGISFESPNAGTAPFVGKDDYIAEVTGGNSTTGYTYNFIAPTLYDTVMNDNEAAVGFGRTFTYTSNNVWVEAGGPASILAGTALAYSGKTLNVQLDGFTNTTNGSNQITVLKSPNLTGGAAGSVPYQTGGNVTTMLPAGTTSQVLISGASPSWTNTPTLTGTNFTGVPNGALINSNVVIGATTVNLGDTVTTFTGLTSVTSTNFYGNVTGTNVSATNLTGTLQTAAQPNVTSVGTLSGLTVTNPIVGNILGSATTVTAGAQPAITSLGALSGLTVNGNVVVNGQTSTTSLVTGNAQVTGGSIAGSTSIDVTNGTIDNMTTGNLQATGGAVSGLSTLGATTATFTTTNAGNLQATSGTVTGLTTLGVTNGTITNFTTGNAQVTGGSVTGLSTLGATNGTVTNLVSGNVQLTGGNVTGIANLGATDGTITNMYSGNVTITGGTIDGTPFTGSTVNATTMTTNDAQITGGNIQSTPISGSTGNFTKVFTANAQVTGGVITGLTTLGATNGTVTNFGSSNVALTGGNATGLTNIQATNLASGNVNLTGGNINGTTIGGTTPAVGTFSTLFTSNAQITGGVITGTTVDITSIAASNVAITGGYIDGTVIGGNVVAAGSFAALNASGLVRFTDLTQSNTPNDGAVVIDGGVGIKKNLNVLGNVVIDGNLQVNGTVTTVNSTTVDVADLNITIAKGALTDSAANGAGITVDGPAAATILYNQPTQTWNLNLPVVSSEFRGNVVGTNLTGTLQTAAQPNVTSLGTLSSLGVTNATTTGSLVTGNAQITGGSIAGSASIDVTNGTIDNMSSGNVAITGGSITSTAGSFTTLAASTSFNATTSGAVTLSSGTQGSMNNVVIGNVTRAPAYFTSVTGGLSTFSAINNTIIGNSQAAAGTFTAINGSDVTVTDVYTVGVTATGTSLLNDVTANTVTVNTSLTSNTAALFNGTLTANGATTFNSTVTANNQVTLSPATGTVTINPVTAGTMANMAVTATTLTTAAATITGGNIDGTNIGTTVPAIGYFSTLSGGSFTAASINNTPVGNAVPSTGDFTYLSANAGITGTLMTNAQPNINSVGTLSSLNVSAATNTGSLVTSNAQVTGGNINSTPVGVGGASSGAFTTLSATSGITGNLVTAVQTAITTVGTLGNLNVTGITDTGTLQASLVNTGNAQITGGNITNTTISGGIANVDKLITANAQITGGAINSTPIGASIASSGAFTTLTTSSSANVNSLVTSNAQITGGSISGVGITASTGSFSTLSGTTTSATNFSTGNAVISGGSINATPIGAGTADSGAFTTITSSSTMQANGVFTANAGVESTSTGIGSIVVVGGVGVSGNVNVGNGLWVNANQSAQPAVFKGVTDNTLVYVNSSTNQVMFGGNVTEANIATAFVPNATVIFNSTDSILMPVGTSGQRPSPATVVKGMTRFNSTFNYMEYWNGTVWASTDTVFTLITDQQFTGDGLQKNFTLSAPSTTNATIVSINGVVQIPGLAYSVGTSTLSFDEAPLATDIVDVRVLVTTQTISGTASPNGFNQVIPDDTGIYFWTGSVATTNTWKIDTAGNLLPIGSGRDIGSPTNIVDNVYASNVVISGGSISGVSFTLAAIDNTVIGNAVPVAGTFTSVTGTSKVACTGDAPVTFDGAAHAFGASATVVDSFDKATYRAAKYVVSVTNGSNFQVAEVLVTHDGTYAYSTLYGIVSSTGSTFASFNAIVNGANVELKATGTGAGNTVKVQKIYIAV